MHWVQPIQGTARGPAPASDTACCGNTLLTCRARREHDYMCEIVGLRSQVEGLSEDLDKLRCLNVRLDSSITHLPTPARKADAHWPSRPQEVQYQTFHACCCVQAELQQRVQQLQQSAPQVTHQPSAARQGRDKTQLYRTKYYK